MKRRQGISTDKYGHRVRGKVGKRKFQRRFPLSATDEEMMFWRNRQFEMLRVAEAIAKLPPVPPRSIDGLCYIYVIRLGGAVKIGRAVDVSQRMRALQAGSPEPLSLLAAVPGHASLEAHIHRRFDHLRREGSEWFTLDDSLLWFISRLADDINPVALLYRETVAQATADAVEGRSPRPCPAPAPDQLA